MSLFQEPWLDVPFLAYWYAEELYIHYCVMHRQLWTFTWWLEKDWHQWL